MKLSDALKKNKLVVLHGPIGTRLKFDYGLVIGENISIEELVTQEKGRVALSEIFQADIKAAKNADVPIVVNALTYRASKNHLPDLSSSLEGVERLNGVCIEFAMSLRDLFPDSIILGAPIGSMYDAYSVEKIPDVKEAIKYHSQQVSFFQQYEVDFVNAITLPSLNEALGVAKAIEQADLDYTIGFKLNAEGCLLDGTPLDVAIAQVDAGTLKKPLGYMVYCTHSSAMSELDQLNKAFSRLMGIKANASALAPKVLESAKQPMADPPGAFSSELKKLSDVFDLTILGGCCGTSLAHLKAILNRCA